MSAKDEQIKFLQYRVEALEKELEKKSKHRIGNLLNDIKNLLTDEGLNKHQKIVDRITEKLRYTIVSKKRNSTDKILVSDDAFLSCVDELATQITEMNYGAEAYDVDDSGDRFSEEAQDYYNEMFSEYEELINATLNVWNKQREI